MNTHPSEITQLCLHSAPEHADAKAAHKHDADGNPLLSFRGPLHHLATLTQNEVRYHGANTEVPVPAHPTPPPPLFHLLDTPIPLTAA